MSTTPTPIIDTICTSVLAGQAVFVHALNSVLIAGSVLTAKFEWNFGDPGHKYNLMQGFNASHIYDQPGTYYIILKVTNELGKSAAVSQQIVVAPDTRPTIYVSSSAGSDSNTGSDASHPVQTPAYALQLAGATNARILLSRGDTFNLVNSLVLGSNVTLGAYGSASAPQPILRYTGSSAGGFFLVGITSDSVQNVVIQDLTFDSTTTDALADAIDARGTGITVRNNTFLNLYSAVNANGNPTGLMVQDNSAPLDTGLAGYFVWLQGSDSVIVGNTVANSTRQHVVRASFGYTRTNICDNTFANLDRRPLGDSLDYSKTDINLQLGSYAYVRDNVLNDGPLRIGPLGGADEMQVDPTGYQLERTSWIVLEGNTLNNTYVDVAYGLQNAVARDNVIHNDGGQAFNLAGYDPTYNQAVVNFAMVDNTAINNSSLGNFIKLWGPASGITMDGNLYLAPNLNAGAYDTAAVWVHQSDLSSFSEIHNNIWSVPATYTWWSNNNINYVFNGNDRSGYKSPSDWAAYSQVSGDLFMNVTPTNGYQFSANGILYGADLSEF